MVLGHHYQVFNELWNNVYLQRWAWMKTMKTLNNITPIYNHLPIVKCHLILSLLGCLSPASSGPVHVHDQTSSSMYCHMSQVPTAVQCHSLPAPYNRHPYTVSLVSSKSDDVCCCYTMIYWTALQWHPTEIALLGNHDSPDQFCRLGFSHFLDQTLFF